MITAKISTVFQADQAAMHEISRAKGVFADLPAAHRLSVLRIWTEGEPTEMAALGASLPKSLRFKTWSSNRHGRLEVNLTPNDATGEKNEAGIKRFRRCVELLERAGVEVTFDGKPGHWNAYRTEAEMEAALAQYERG